MFSLFLLCVRGAFSLVRRSRRSVSRTEGRHDVWSSSLARFGPYPFFSFSDPDNFACIGPSPPVCVCVCVCVVISSTAGRRQLVTYSSVFEGRQVMRRAHARGRARTHTTTHTRTRARAHQHVYARAQTRRRAHANAHVHAHNHTRARTSSPARVRGHVHTKCTSALSLSRTPLATRPPDGSVRWMTRIDDLNR